jgi:undecaprenyl-diphosphatase
MTELNRVLFDWIFKFAHRSSMLDAVGVFVAEILPYLIVFFLLRMLIRAKSSKWRILFFVEVILAFILSRGILMEFFHLFYPQLRPFQVLNIKALISVFGPAFPSGHASTFFPFAMTIFFFDRKLGMWALLIALLNGIARIYVGVHWPVDILGGMVFGILSAILVHELIGPSFKGIKLKTIEAEADR